MDIPGDIFNEFVDQEEELHQLLGILKKRLPETRFQILDKRDGDIIVGEELPLSRDTRNHIVEQVGQEKSCHYEHPGDPFIYATGIKELNTFLIAAFPKKTPLSDVRDHYITITRLCIALFLSQKIYGDEAEFRLIQKKQFDRKFRVLEKNYQEILEDNQ